MNISTGLHPIVLSGLCLNFNFLVSCLQKTLIKSFLLNTPTSYSWEWPPSSTNTLLLILIFFFPSLPSPSPRPFHYPSFFLFLSLGFLQAVIPEATSYQKTETHHTLLIHQFLQFIRLFFFCVPWMLEGWHRVSLGARHSVGTSSQLSEQLWIPCWPSPTAERSISD